MAPESTIYQSAETQYFEPRKSQINLPTKVEAGKTVNPISVGTFAFEASQAIASYTGIDLYGISQVTKAGNWVRNLFQKKAEREIVSGRGYQLKMPFWTKATTAFIASSVLYFGGLGNGINNVVEIIKDPTNTAQLLKDPEAQAAPLTVKNEIFRWFDGQGRKLDIRNAVITSNCDNNLLNQGEYYNYWAHLNIDVESSNLTETALNNGERVKDDLHFSYRGAEPVNTNGMIEQIYHFDLVNSRGDTLFREFTSQPNGDTEAALSDVSQQLATYLQERYPNFQGLGDNLNNEPGGVLNGNLPSPNPGTLDSEIKRLVEITREANNGGDIVWGQDDLNQIMHNILGTDICPDGQMNDFHIQPIYRTNSSLEIAAAALPFVILDAAEANAWDFGFVFLF